MSDYNLFINKIHNKTGIDLSLYKEAQMKRRLTALRDKRGFTTFLDYYNAIKQDDDLLNEFLQRMTINVSEFFRNPQRWDILEEQILPKVLSNNSRLKVWSAACSTGEEPYSLVMMLNKYISLDKMEILATDLDEEILQRAKIGLYSERSLKEVPLKWKDAYFHKEDIGYKISNTIKKPIRFKQHNLLSDTYETGFDLIVCRNVMIYFTEEAKNELYHKFSNALKKDGILFVGSTEQIFNPKKYNLVSEDTFFYRKL
ncbi:protein-glutamate O-methyltransferase CheR [Evansella sp. AB-P1]|uniref:CheR family methyltransferase n=1 Tax=Evansella sp. AB-P1 TaxID=3037653 RepID=UPI00241F444B|nr:protein-glutamate O-methyltransferase CheR [Evansella sp. AB-P1]MDG5787597.1 protein-glutamate O-methyltransferase CheR [Evansella sp. AB-P1]